MIIEYICQSQNICLEMPWWGSLEAKHLFMGYHGFCMIFIGDRMEISWTKKLKMVVLPPTEQLPTRNFERKSA